MRFHCFPFPRPDSSVDLSPGPACAGAGVRSGCASAIRAISWKVCSTGAFLRRSTGRFTASSFTIPWDPTLDSPADSAQRVLGRDPRSNLLASIASTAASGGFQTCESHLGARAQESTDWTNLSSLLAEVLGPVFLEMEKQASLWQSVRGSTTLPAFGSFGSLSEYGSEDGQTVDVRPMIESFRLGIQNLLDVWGLVLPPTTLLELRKLSRLPADQFRLPDELWVRVVYDFALGHRLRDHESRSSASLDHPALSGMDRFLCAGIEKRRACGNRGPDRTLRQGI